MATAVQIKLAWLGKERLLRCILLARAGPRCRQIYIYQQCKMRHFWSTDFQGVLAVLCQNLNRFSNLTVYNSWKYYKCKYYKFNIYYLTINFILYKCKYHNYLLQGRHISRVCNSFEIWCNTSVQIPIINVSVLLLLLLYTKILKLMIT